MDVQYVFNISGDSINQTFRVVLDGQTYEITMFWNERDESWLFSIGDIGEDPTVTFKLTTFVDLLGPYRYKENLPTGVLYLSGSSDYRTRVGRYNIGEDSQIYMWYASDYEG